MWTARRTIPKNTQKVDIFEEIEFLGFSQNSQFSKTDHRFWKSYKASISDQSMHLFGRWPLGHTLPSKFSPFSNRKFSPFLHTSGLSTKFWNFFNTVFMRKKYSWKCYQKPLLMIQKHIKLWTGCLHRCTKKWIDFFLLQAMVLLGH